MDATFFQKVLGQEKIGSQNEFDSKGVLILQVDPWSESQRDATSQAGGAELQLHQPEHW